MNEVALRANDVLRNDVMLRINDVALCANISPLSSAQKYDIIKTKKENRQIPSFMKTKETYK